MIRRMEVRGRAIADTITLTNEGQTIAERRAPPPLAERF
jgi:hypothetical protein